MLYLGKLRVLCFHAIQGPGVNTVFQGRWKDSSAMNAFSLSLVFNYIVFNMKINCCLPDLIPKKKIIPVGEQKLITQKKHNKLLITYDFLALRTMAKVSMPKAASTTLVFYPSAFLWLSWKVWSRYRTSWVRYAQPLYCSNCTVIDYHSVC